MKQTVAEKSFLFSVRIVNLQKYLNQAKKEYILAGQLVRSGTSIGANVSEAKFAQSRADFISKMHIALKEAGETEYWLSLLHETNYLTDHEFQSMITDCREIVKMLSAIIKSAKGSTINY